MLTNAVRHGGAKQLWIDVEETTTEYIIRYTNDGIAHNSPIKEGGGLSTARRKIEAFGGRMHIQTGPRFMLTIIFDKGGMTDV
jgi:signal transduction histidine kinase